MKTYFIPSSLSAPRSGLAAKYFIDVGGECLPTPDCEPEIHVLFWCSYLLCIAGVVDEDYRGNVGVVLFNFGKDTFEGECVTHNMTHASNGNGYILERWGIMMVSHELKM